MRRMQQWIYQNGSTLAVVMAAVAVFRWAW